MIFEDGDLAEILAYGAERTWVEFKSPGPLTDRRLVAQVVRAMMAMANTGGGGLVVVGVRQGGSSFEAVGLSQEDLDSWSREDEFADRVAAWADPPVRYRLHRPVADGSTFVVVNVEEFDREPVICRKGYDDVLAEGACYVRPRRKPESVPVRTTADMRDLIRLAADKELRGFLSRAQAGGLNLGPSDAARYAAQLDEPPPDGDIDIQVRSRGRWEVTIRPAKFDAARVPFSDLEDVIRTGAVKLRGWDFPHVDHRAQVARGVDWVGQGSSWYGNNELWRLWTSGQFLSVRSMREDWLAESWGRSGPTAAPGTTLGVLETLICFWEVYEFAAHLALTPAGAPDIQVKVTAVGLAGRLLVVDSPGRAPFAFEYRATLAEYPDELNVSTAQLAADPMQLAVDAAGRLFGRFGWQPDPAVLKSALEEFRRSR